MKLATFVALAFAGAAVVLMATASALMVRGAHPRWVVVGGGRTLVDFGSVPSEREAKAACLAAAEKIWNGYCDRYPAEEAK